MEEGCFDGRAVQGKGSGGINMIVDINVSDLVPVREWGYFMAIILTVYSCSTALGAIHWRCYCWEHHLAMCTIELPSFSETQTNLLRPIPGLLDQSYGNLLNFHFHESKVNQRTGRWVSLDYDL